MHPPMQVLWGDIWKRTVGRNQTNATNVTLHPHWQAIWGDIWRRTLEKAKQMQPVWLCVCSGRQFEETFENTQWRKAKQMQPMWLCILPDRQFEGTFEKAQWRKAKQMQPMWLCILLCKQFGETFENTQSGKVKLKSQLGHKRNCESKIHKIENMFWSKNLLQKHVFGTTFVYFGFSLNFFSQLWL